MAGVEHKVGDRIVVNNRANAHQGKKGEVRYASGNQYWIRIDGEQETDQLGFFGWWLDPLPAGS